MQLTVRDVAKFLHVSERTVYRWLQQGALPAYRIFDQYRFNRAELLEWATAQKMKIDPAIFHDADSDAQLPSLTEAVMQGGIYYRVGGSDKSSVLDSVVHQLRLPEDIDRDFLLKVLLAREELSSTAVGKGIAIPHARNPIVAHIPSSMIALCFLEQPVDFGALDGEPVHCLFTVISTTVRTHLHLLSRLAFALHFPAIADVLVRHGSRDDIIQQMKAVDLKIESS